jgi:predicted transcriptional regulator
MLLHLKSGQEISAEELDEMVNTILLCKDTLDFIKQHDLNHCPDLYTVDKLTSLLKYIMIVNG